jgi:hypothetical protein
MGRRAIAIFFGDESVVHKFLKESESSLMEKRLIGAHPFRRNKLLNFISSDPLLRFLLPAFIIAASLLSVNCGGGSSSSSSGKTPAITSLSPNNAAIGGSSLAVTITGSNFTSSGCSARWNGSDRSTSYVSSTTLKFTAMSSDFVNTATVPITVSCNGKTSNSANFYVNNPSPTLKSTSPASATAGSNTIVLTLKGSHFLSSSTALWNGNQRSCTYVSSSAVQITLASTDLTTAATASVAVVNPGPGGGQSTLSFPIKVLEPLVVTSKIIPDAASNKTYSYTLLASGGVQPYTWTRTSGSLPSGLEIAGSGKISGTASAVSADTTSNFIVQITDHAVQASSATQSLSLKVRAAGSLGRNDSIATATPITNGTIRASISPTGDVDVYSFQGTAGAQVAIEITAQRLSSETLDDQLDSYLELLDSSGGVLRSSDDYDPSISWDSKISNYGLTSSGTYYIRISSARGDGRPDFQYNLTLSGAN